MGVIWRRLCVKYDLRKGDLFVLSWDRGETNDTGKYLFRATNVLLLLLAMIRSVVKSFKVPVVEVAELTNRFHWILP